MQVHDWIRRPAARNLQVARLLYAQVHGRDAYSSTWGRSRRKLGLGRRPALLPCADLSSRSTAGLTNEHFSGSGAACTLMHAMFIAGGGGIRIQIPKPGPTEMALSFQGVTGQELARSGPYQLGYLLIMSGIVSACHYIRWGSECDAIG